MFHLACQVEDNWNRRGKVLSSYKSVLIRRLSIVTVCNGAYLSQVNQVENLNHEWNCRNYSNFVFAFLEMVCSILS